VPDPPVCNASPLIVLARAGHLDLLRAVYDTVIVPAAVADEVLDGPAADAGATALRTESWLHRTVVPDVPLSIVGWDLGMGETEVLTWALRHPGCEAILDDRLGRRCVRAFAIPVRGTVGVILLAKRCGIIPAARPVVESLRAAGLFISPAVLGTSLRLVGE